MSSVLLAAPTAAHFEAERAPAQRLGGGGDLLWEFVSEDSAESRSPPGSPTSAPWAAGLGENWMAL